ncbi:MAG: ribose-phosphate pyrophosphokinase [Candidatus Aenigmarchaeota archaeon]|nr:ribose-phosphate pyrophosphokinase [Candidatus Aenigmarchaeota archaeon]
MPNILPCSGTARLAESISRVSGFGIIKKNVNKFPDGEMHIKLENVDFKGDVVYILQSLFPDQNNSIVELLLTINAVSESGGRPVAVVPYMPYSRQDKLFEKGEAFSLKAILMSMKACGAERLITVDPHFSRREGKSVMFGLTVTSLSASKAVYDYAKSVNGSIVLVGPDEGSMDFLSDLKCTVFMKKKKKFEDRKDGTLNYKISLDVPDFNGKNVLLMDDIISSGETMVTAAKLLKGKGKNVSIACTHGLFIGDSAKKLKKYSDTIIATDTVESEFSKVSVAEIIAREISE